jgi:hypothetical protein
MNIITTLIIGLIPFLIAVFNRRSPFPKHRLFRMFKWNGIVAVAYWLLSSLPFIGGMLSIAWVLLVLWSVFPNWIIFKWLK